MPNKYTREEQNKIADRECNKNNLIRIEDCLSYHKTFKAKTQEGYLVCPSIRSLRLGKQPLKYSKSNPYTIYNIRLWLKLNNKTIKLVSEEYEDSSANLKWVCKNNKCKRYNKEFLKGWDIIQRGIGCPDCGIASRSETKITPPNGESLFDKYFELCQKNWDYTRNDKKPNFYYPNSNQKVYWKCGECGFLLENQLLINNVVRHGISCPRCSNGISYPEKLMFAVLIQLKTVFSTQKMFEWSKNAKHINKKISGRKLYDFWIEPFNCIIETHGNIHYKSAKWKGKKQKTLKEEQLNDLFKEKLAKDNGIERYIVINCKKSDLSYIKNNILNSELSKIFNLRLIDWAKAHEEACKNITKEICELWKSGIKSTSEICKIVKLSRSVVIIHLKKGVEIGWCDYDPNEAKRRNGALNGKNNGKPVIQLNEQGVFIKRHDSISEASKLLKLQSANISKVCKKERKSTGGFIFIYEEEYKVKEDNK